MTRQAGPTGQPGTAGHPARTVGLHGDAGPVLAALAGRLADEPGESRHGAKRAEAARPDIEWAALVDGSAWRPVQDALRAALPADTVVAGTAPRFRTTAPPTSGRRADRMDPGGALSAGQRA